MEVQQARTSTLSDAERIIDEEEELAAPRRSILARITPQWLAILWENKKSRVGLVILAMFAIVAIFAPWIAPYDPGSKEFQGNLPASSDHWLGTTTAGEDIFSQLVQGSRTSLVIGILGGLMATVIALIVGMSAGYLQGLPDEFLSMLINVAMLIPFLPLIILIAAYSPISGTLPIVLIIGITSWAWGARIKRAQMVTLRTRDFITAAIFAGEGFWRIIFKEILPNMLSLVVLGYLGAALGAMGAEFGLSVLGLTDPDVISWGKMLYWADNQGALLTGQWEWLVAPGACMSLLIVSFTLINFGIDALSNPHLRQE